MAHGDPLVSVVVRSMARPSLAASLDSIAAQQYESIEIVVVAALGPTHSDVPSRAGAHEIRLVRTARPLPRPAAANAGLAAARGDWITFLDDDDVWLPPHVQTLMAARGAAPDAGVIHGLARAVRADGSSGPFGQPHARMELFDRNYLHLSTALVRADLIAGGCRFDERLEILEDWDFFQQLAERTRFHFVPRETFVWHADAGSSGGGVGANEDDARFAAFRSEVYAKWHHVHEKLLAYVTTVLQQAQAHAQRGDYAAAEERCRAALAASENDPWALNLLAMVRSAAGDTAGALAAQRLAVQVRPHDAALAHNLAVLYRARGDLAAARRWVARALDLDHGFAPAARLEVELGQAASRRS